MDDIGQQQIYIHYICGISLSLMKTRSLWVYLFRQQYFTLHTDKLYFRCENMLKMDCCFQVL